MKLYVEKRKSKSGREWLGLWMDLGYRQTVLSFDKMLISELTGKTLEELYSYELNKRIEINK